MNRENKPTSRQHELLLPTSGMNDPKLLLLMHHAGTAAPAASAAVIFLLVLGIALALRSWLSMYSVLG